MPELLPQTRDEFMAVWNALAQYVQNGTEAEELGDPPPDLGAARAMLARFESVIANVVH